MKRKAIMNLYMSLLLQIVTIISGLIIPRLILSTFGSEVNGMVSSLNQFLNYIALLEGGLGSVTLAALYSPLAENNNSKLSGIIVATNRFFKNIAYIFLAYCVCLSVIYPLVVTSSFSWEYVFGLTWILSIQLFCQYYFAITYKLILQADQRLYIVNILQIISCILNLILTFVIIKLYPSIHLVKLLAAIAYIIQPIVLNKYVNKKYSIDKKEKPDSDALKQRWNCFGQNFAFFIHNNTDVVILTVLGNLKTVSVYAVYLLIINSVKNLVMSLSSAFAPIIGRFLAKKDSEGVNKSIDIYEFCMYSVSTVVFGSCLYLIEPFVMLYTEGINDVNYSQPVFAAILVMAEYIYCVRDPYISTVYAAGKFKETAVSAYVEAAINIVISAFLVTKFGLIGVAIGTLLGMLYRMIYQIIYLRKNIVFRHYQKAIKRFIISIVIMLTGNLFINAIYRMDSLNFLNWIFGGVLCVIVFVALIGFATIIFDKKIFTMLINRRKHEEKH